MRSVVKRKNFWLQFIKFVELQIIVIETEKSYGILESKPIKKQKKVLWFYLLWSKDLREFFVGCTLVTIEALKKIIKFKIKNNSHILIKHPGSF